MIKTASKCILLFTLVFSVICKADVFSTDDLHRNVRLQKPAQRIISLAPDITEILFAIGAHHQIVGVISGSDYPKAALDLPIVGNYAGLDIEKIISLKPDLIITWQSAFSRQMHLLSKLGLPIYMTSPKALHDVSRTMRHLGILTHHQQTAEQAANEYENKLAQFAAIYQHQKPLRVFYQIGAYSLMTINRSSWINQVIAICGGENSFANTKTITPEISWEALVVANPEVILSGTNETTWQEPFKKWPQIAAVNAGLLYAVNPDLINRASPRLINAVETVCLALKDARSHLIDDNGNQLKVLPKLT